MVINALVSFFLLFSGDIMGQVNEPKFKVIQNFGSIEIREYDHLLIAQVEVSGERSVAIRAGFKQLADYIFGNNTLKQKISMTAPVLQQASSNDKNKNWHISFVMPLEYTMSSLPSPNTNINIKELTHKQYLVIQFSGFSSDSNLQKHLLKINQFAQEHGLKTINQPIFAFYNPPWTLPFLRKNEIMLEIKN